MEFEDNTKLALIFAILPWAIAYILYKNSLFTAEITVIITFMILSLICFSFKQLGKYLKFVLDKVGKFLGKYIAILVLMIVYICTVLPTGIIMKMVKRDRLRLKKQNLSSYWTDYSEKQKDYEYQF